MSTVEERKKATERKRARRSAEKKGQVSKGDGKDVDHKKPLSEGGASKDSNTRVVSRAKNRADGGKIGGKKVRGAAKQKAGAKGGRNSSRKGVPNKK